MRYSYGFSDWRGMIGSTGGVSGGITPASLGIDMFSEFEEEETVKDKKEEKKVSTPKDKKDK